MISFLFSSLYLSFFSRTERGYLLSLSRSLSRSRDGSCNQTSAVGLSRVTDQEVFFGRGSLINPFGHRCSIFSLFHHHAAVFFSVCIFLLSSFLSALACTQQGRASEEERRRRFGLVPPLTAIFMRACMCACVREPLSSSLPPSSSLAAKERGRGKTRQGVSSRASFQVRQWQPCSVACQASKQARWWSIVVVVDGGRRSVAKQLCNEIKKRGKEEEEEERGRRRRPSLPPLSLPSSCCSGEGCSFLLLLPLLLFYILATPSLPPSSLFHLFSPSPFCCCHPQDRYLFPPSFFPPHRQVLSSLLLGCENSSPSPSLPSSSPFSKLVGLPPTTLLLRSRAAESSRLLSLSPFLSAKE